MNRDETSLREKLDSVATQDTDDHEQVHKIEKITTQLMAIFSQPVFIKEVGLVNPKNVDAKITVANKKNEIRYERAVSEHGETLTLIPMLEAGLSEDEYKTHRALINKYCREISGFATDGHHYFNITNEDSWAQELPQEDSVLTDLEDGVYSNKINIFDHSRRSSFERDAIYDHLPPSLPKDEGYIFHRIYDENGHLSKVKIYAQEHRNTLIVKTVNIMDLLERLRTLAMPSRKVIEKPPDIISAEEFNKLINQFNRDFGHCASIVSHVNDSGEEVFELYFVGDNSVVQSKLKILSSKYDLEIDDKMCVNDGSWENRVGAFIMLEKLEDEYIESHSGHYIVQPPHLTLQFHKNDSIKLASLVADFIASDEKKN